MKTFSRFFVAVTLALSLVFSGPVACRTNLDPAGVYQGDTFLYNVEKTTVTAYKSFDAFLKWELQYREILPVEVSRAADTIRKNAKSWIDSSIALRDAYVKTPTAENKDRLQLSINLIDTALAEAAKQMARHKSKAPNIGLK